MEEQDPLWFKDAIFYEVPVKSFFDSNNDGIGDIRGVTLKLDYLKDLGVDCLWLLPFYKSPLKDDGYDVSDYYEIQPEYGTMDDFRELVEEAHSRGLRIILDLVANHVSDQSSWFQEAISGRNSPKRDWFVWSDTPDKYPLARVIFKDTETSNWAWEPKTKQYYWHRFYSHQPELNYDNQEVRNAIVKVIRYWLGMGIDGFRCDAVPFLFEKEGTNCENLPETHQFFKEIRKMVDADYPGRILLAEANQWPTEAKEYFGDQDEFHMAFNFPLMSRIFIALVKDSIYPITNIVRDTIPVPEKCDWAIFLRNHDELTLEMVSDEERDVMFKEYARLPKMKLNLGIRRRLAPLVDNDRDTLEMLHALILSLPGCPVLYYGDEIGMGDNIYLGDRNGVRTPMQWSHDRNAGFSLADAEQLFSPVITNPNYHYESTNVESESRLPTSLLNWIKKMLRVRKKFSKVMGRGSFRLIQNDNPKILPFIREYGDEKILCLYNISRMPAFLEMDLREFSGYTPREAVTDTDFPTIGELPYFFTFPPRSFFWMSLRRVTEQEKGEKDET